MPPSLIGPLKESHFLFSYGGLPGIPYSYSFPSKERQGKGRLSPYSKILYFNITLSGIAPKDFARLRKPKIDNALVPRGAATERTITL